MADDLQISPADRDIAIRTMLGEEGNPEAQAGVASTMLNRATSGKYGGKSLSAVAFAPGQFEPWAARSKELLDIPETHPAYQRAAQIFDGVVSGDVPDFTGGATHFYAPKAQAALGRNAPAWAKGDSTALGSTLFYAPDGPVKYSPAGKAIDVAPNLPAPFSEYETAGAAKPAAGLSAKAAESLPDPFSEYPTASAKTAPEASVKAPPPADTSGPATVGSGPAAVGQGLMEGVPIAGPYILGGAQRLAAGIRSLQNNTRFSDELENVRNFSKATAEDHPNAFTAGQVGGAVAGTLPLVAAAPAAFGISGSGLAVNALTGAATGAAIGSADSAVRSGGDVDAMKRGALVGAGLGAAGPVAGRALGAGVDAAANLFSRTTSAARNVANMLSEAGMTPADAEATLKRIGPSATLADVNPALTTDAGALAAMGGKPTAILKTAMGQRAAGANERVAQAIDQNLGSRPDLTAAQDAIREKASTTASPFYQAAQTSAGKMDVAPVLASIDGQLKNAVGGVADILKRAKGYLTSETVPIPSNSAGGKTVPMIVPKDDPQALLSARQALDDFIEKAPRSGDTTAGANAMRAAQNMRGQIDKVLKSDPNIAAGDAAYATQMRNLDALNEGTELFKPNTRIEDVTRSLAGKTPEQAGAMRQGALSAIHDAFDNARQGDFSAARSLFAKSSANRAKLDALFPNSGKVFDMLDGEIAMRATEQRVAGNSATAERQAAMQKYKPTDAFGGIGATAPILGEAVAGGPGAAAATVGRMAYGGLKNAFTEAANARLTEGTARGLASIGNDRSMFMDQVTRAAKTNGATGSLSQGASTAANLLIRAQQREVENRLSGR